MVTAFLLGLESASDLFLNELLGLFQYPPGSGGVLLAGNLSFRYCAARFACRALLGGCQFLVMLLVWLLLVLVLCRRLWLMVLVRRFNGLVVLDLDGKELV